MGANVNDVQRLYRRATAAMMLGRNGHSLCDDPAGVVGTRATANERVAVSLGYLRLDRDEAEPIYAAS
jgi:hypothetical protein